MTLRDSQLTGRLRLRHLMETTEAVGEIMDEERNRFDRLRDPASKPRAVSSFNLFQTPEPLADQLAEIGYPRHRVLEPSAGLGRLYRAIRKITPHCDITLVEIAPQCAGELYRGTQGDPHAKLIQGDFLEQTPERLGLFHSIIMNPPFKMGTDIKHIRHAEKFLAPGGRLASLCAAGPKQRAALADVSQWIDLPPGSFKSEGTNVNTAIVIIDR